MDSAGHAKEWGPELEAVGPLGSSGGGGRHDEDDISQLVDGLARVPA